MRRVLINHVYYSPIGHIVEAWKFAAGLRAANSDLVISVLFNAQTPAELSDGCGILENWFTCDIDEVRERGANARSFNSIPREWDVIIDNNLLPKLFDSQKTLGPEEQGLLATHHLVKELFSATEGIGTMWPRELPAGFKYDVEAKVCLNIPPNVKRYKINSSHSPRICVMLGGSGGSYFYPSISSWVKILGAIVDNVPDVVFCLTGISKPIHKGGTCTLAYTGEDIAEITDRVGSVENFYDIGLWNQISLLKDCDVFLSPHTGFGFVALCVGTPWLALSGGNFPEYFFNRVPFYSVLPDNPEFPYEGALSMFRFDTSNLGKVPCMEPHKLELKIPEIVSAVRLLLSPVFTYERAIERHKENISRANVKRDRIPVSPTF